MHESSILKKFFQYIIHFELFHFDDVEKLNQLIPYEYLFVLKNTLNYKLNTLYANLDVILIFFFLHQNQILFPNNFVHHFFYMLSIIQNLLHFLYHIHHY